MKDNLKEERERIRGKDFSDIPMDKQKRMLRIVELMNNSLELHQQVLGQATKTVVTINPELLKDFTKFETAIAMIQATVAHAIYFLIENDYLKYCEGDSE